MRKISLAVALLILTTACAEEKTNTETEKSALEKQLSTQLDAMESAKQTEQLILDADEKRRKAIDGEN